MKGARLRAAAAKNVKSNITGKMKTHGCKSRLDGGDAATITDALGPWLDKPALDKGDMKAMANALDGAGVKSSTGRKLGHHTAKS